MSKRDAISQLFTGPLKKVNPGKALQVAIENNDQRILDLNREQLERGLKADGKSLGKYKNFKYKNRYQPVDLKLTGDFQNKFSLQADEKKTEIFSQDWKEPILEKRYGKEIHGISNDKLQVMGEIIRPDFEREVKNQMVQ